MGTLSEKVTLFIFIFAFHLIRGQLLQKEFASLFIKDCIVQEGKEEVTKIISLCKNGGKIEVYPYTLT